MPNVNAVLNPLEVISWQLNGNVSAGTGQDGLRPMPKAGTIVAVIVSAEQRGNTGVALFDLNKHVPAKPITTQRNATAGVTMYTTQGNRPDLDGLSGSSSDNAIKEAVLPDILTFLAGDFLSMDVDNALSVLQDVTVFVLVQFDS